MLKLQPPLVQRLSLVDLLLALDTVLHEKLYNDFMLRRQLVNDAYSGCSDEFCSLAVHNGLQIAKLTLEVSLDLRKGFGHVLFDPLVTALAHLHH